MVDNKIFDENNPPQLNEVSDLLYEKTGFTIRPIEGLVTARDFLNHLAYRIFPSTQ